MDRLYSVWYHEQGLSQSVIETIANEGAWENTRSLHLPLSEKEKKILSYLPSVDEMESLLENLLSRGIRVYLRNEEGFPFPLKEIPDAPYLLYIKGDYEPEDLLAVSVVGARKCTHYGAWACEKFVRELSPYQVTIVSGLALGIDRIAHETAIENGTRTIAVIGNGLDTIYPASHRNLYPKVVDNGCIITEFPTWAGSLPHHFPYRNRLIAGLSLGTIVIEAKKKSGTMSTATHALEQGKEVFCVPGNLNSVFSEGCNALIQEGAKILLQVDDILEELAITTRAEQLGFTSMEEESDILQCLSAGPLTVDDLVQKLKLPVHELQIELTKLELLGQISIDGSLIQTIR